MKSKNFKQVIGIVILLLTMSSASVWATEYELVTSTSGLVAGAKYVIGNGASGSVKFMSTTSENNYRHETSAQTVTNNKVTATNDMLVLTLGGSTGQWTFYTYNYAGTDGYLASAASGNNNYCRVIATSTTCTISISSNVATIALNPHSSRKYLKYNSGSTRFACYSSGQSAVYLYKEVTGGGECAAPTSPTNGATTHATTGQNGEQVVSWSGTPSNYLVYYKGNSTTPSSSQEASRTVNGAKTETLTGLTAGQYWWWVRSNCGADNKSDWVAGSSFTINGIKLGGTIPVAFGEVTQGSSVADKTIKVTGVGLSSGTNITASFPEGSPFSVSPSSVNYNANQATLTISASTATAGAYDQNLTLSYGGTYTATVKVTMTVVAEDKFIDVLQNSSGYEEATPHTETGAYSTPTLADKVKSAGTCEGEHYHFVGWITKAKYDAGTAISGSDLQTPTSATGATYYAVWGDGVPTATYSRLESVASIDGSAQYVLGIDGAGFHYSGTSGWGLTALPASQTPLYYTLAIVSTSDKTFTASTKIGNTTYYLTVPTSNTFTMSTTSSTLYLGKGSNNYSDNYGICNSSTKDRHIRKNGDSGLRSYAGTTGSQAYFYKVVASDDIDYKAKCCSDAAVVTLSPSSQTVYRDIDGNAAATIGFSQTGGGSGSWGSPTVSPSGPTVTKNGANINFSATATGTYTVGIGFTETCEKTGSATVTVAEQPIITASGTTTFSTTCGTNSASSDITVNSRYLSGSTITASITTSPGSGNFTISTDNSTFDTSNKSISGGTSSKVTSHIYVRYEPAADETGSIAGTLTLTCGGKTETVSLSGTVTCGCSIRFTSDANLVRVTAANGIWVQANSELALSGSYLKTNDDGANVSIRAYTNNAHFQLKGHDVAGEGAAKTSTSNALSLATNNSSNTANGWTGSIGIVYKPEAHNTTETATLTVEVYRYGGSTVYATTTYTLYGRSLPENFVIAVTNGSGSWFAIPADMVAPWGGNCSSGLGTYTPYPIEVNNTTTPTALTSDPPSRAIYTAAARTGAVNTNPQTLSFKSVTLAGSGNYYLYGSQGSATTIQDASNNESEHQKWFLDVIDWSTKKYNMHLDAELNTKLLSYYSGNVGQYAASGKKPDIFILPATSTCTYYLAPTNITCQDIDDDYYYFRFKPDRTTNYEVSLDGSSWYDLTTTIADECTDDEHPTLLEGKVALATYRGQTVHIRVKSAGGCQSSTTFSVPNPNIAVNSGTWLSMTGIAGYAFSNTANSVTISGLASCGSQVVGVTCSNGDISASVNQSTGVVTISMTAGNATAGVHTGTLTFTLTGGTTRTQNIQITLQNKAPQSWDGGDAVFFPGDDDNTRMLCYNSDKIAAAAYTSATEPTVCLSYAMYYNGALLSSVSNFNTYSNLYLMDMSTGTEVTTHAITRSVSSSGVVTVTFTYLLGYNDFIVGHRYRLIWENHSSDNTYEDQFTNSAGVPFQDCYMDFVYTTNCDAPSLLPACATATTVDLYWRDTEDGCSSTQTVEVYTKSSTEAASKNLTNSALSAWNYVGNVNTNKQSWMWDDKNTGYTMPSLSDAGYVITNVNSDKYGVIYSPVFNTIANFDATEQFTIEITLKANSASDANVGVQLWLVADNSSNAGNHTWSDTENSSADFNQTGNSTVKILNIPTTAKTYSFDITGAVATNRIKIKGYEGASIASSTKNVYIRSIAIKKNSHSTVKSTTVSSSTTHVSFSGLTANTDYYAVVKCGSEESNEVSFKTMSGAAASVNFYSDAEYENAITEATIVAGTPKTVYVRGTNVVLCEDEANVTINSCFNIDSKTLTYNGSTHVLEGNITISNVCAAADGDLVVDVNGEHVLPLHCGDHLIEVVQWVTNGLQVESYVLAGTPNLGAITGVASNGAYNLTNGSLDLTAHANELLKVTWGERVENFRVPIMITSSCNSSTLTNITDKSVIVVGMNKTLTVNANLTCQSIEIYPGGKLTVSSGKSVTADYIRLYALNGDNWTNTADVSTYGGYLPKLDVSAAGTLNVDNVYADFRIDEDRYHYITLPFDIMTGNVVYAAPAANGPNPPALRNSANNTAFYVRQYDGRTRETNNLATETTYNVNMPHIGTKGGSYSMTAGRGYMIAIGNQASATGHKKRTLRFPIAMNSTKWTAEQASSKVVGGAWVADGTDNASARATNKGWNLVGNPFMRELTVTSTSGGLATGVLETPGEDSYIWKINDNGVRYITIYNAATDAFTYQPLNVSFTLKPMAAFYVQMKNAKYINFQAALTGQAAMPAIMRAPLEEEEAVNVMVKLSVADKSDKTGVVLHSKYDAAYNEDDDADYPKLMSGTQVALWSISGEEQLANNGLPKTSASNIPLGYQAPQTGTYTISLDIDESTLSSLKHVWLTDNDGGTPRDLMLESYTFEVSGTQLRSDRFFLSIELQPKEEILTGTDDAMSESEKPYKFIYQDKLYIMRGGVIYDATGKRVMEINR